MQFALVQAGSVVNVIEWDGDTAAWRPPEGVTAHPLDDTAVVGIGYGYDGGVFNAPASPEPASPSAAAVLARRDTLLAQAALRVAPLEDAIDLDLETPEDIEALTAWKQYRVELSRIEQQASFPDAIEWPVAPT